MNEIRIPLENTESIEIRLTLDKYPIACRQKIQELLSQGAVETEEQAIDILAKNPIVLQLVYEKDNGLFAVETDAIGSGIVSPYSQKDIVDE